MIECKFYVRHHDPDWLHRFRLLTNDSVFLPGVDLTVMSWFFCEIHINDYRFS
jgi:hypothetical protein